MLFSFCGFSLGCFFLSFGSHRDPPLSRDFLTNDIFIITCTGFYAKNIYTISDICVNWIDKIERIGERVILFRRNKRSK